MPISPAELSQLRITQTNARPYIIGLDAVVINQCRYISFFAFFSFVSDQTRVISLIVQLIVISELSFVL